MAETKPPRKRFSPTNLAVYHHNHCELYLWNTYHCTPQVLSNESSLLRQAHFDRGNDWETSLAAWLDEQGLLLTLVAPNLSGDDLKAIVTLDDRSHFFVYGLSFQSPSFQHDFEKYGNGSRKINVGVAKPDLVEFTRLEDSRIRWQVIDAKASKETKTSHHVQIYWYHLCLARLLDDPSFVAAESASVWLPSDGSTGKESCPSLNTLYSVPISLLGPPLEDFFFHQLPRMVHRPQRAVPWHYNALCKGCPFEGDCRTQTTVQKTLGAIPNISLGEAAIVYSLLRSAKQLKMKDGTSTLALSDLEELDLLCRDSRSLEDMAAQHSFTTRRLKQILRLPAKPTAARTMGSARVNAALAQHVHIINTPSYTLPSDEDVAVSLSLVSDPLVSSIGAYCISTIVKPSSKNLAINVEPIFGTISVKSVNLVCDLAAHLKSIMHASKQAEQPLTTQLYVFSSAESVSLQQHLIDVALSATSRDNYYVLECAKICIGAVCEGASLLATAFQPLILSGALLDFLHKRKNLSKEQLRICVERLALPKPPGATQEDLQAALQEEIDRLKSAGGRGVGKQELGQLPHVVVLKKEMSRLVALPIPGYWDLPEAVMCLLSKRRKCPSDDEVFATYREGNDELLKASMLTRNGCIYDIVKNMRKRVHPDVTGGPPLLLNQAKVLTSNFMDICRAEPLRKLFFMHQFEVLAKLQDLWQSRVEGCSDAPVIEYLRPRAAQNSDSKPRKRYHEFRLVNGIIEQPSDRENAIYNYLLATEENNGNGSPPEIFFNDLLVSGLVFPLNKYTRSRWDAQAELVKEKVAVADVAQVELGAENSTIVLVSLYGDLERTELRPGRLFRLSQRLVDFNTSKILSTLVEIDLDLETYNDAPPFLQLLSDPSSVTYPLDDSSSELRAEQAVHRQFVELDGLGVASAGALVLKSSQRKAARRILTSNLAVIWGPPGTGKTYTVALSLLRMLEVEARTGQQGFKIIILTAMTHAAIEALMSKLNKLIGHYRSVPNLPVEWLDEVSVQHIKAGATHPLPGRHRIHIYAGTVFQLWHFNRRLRNPVDVVVVDEAGQLSLGCLSLVMRNVSPRSKLIVAGDNEQLAPIFTASYPDTGTRLFGSILDFLMQLFKPPKSLKEDDSQCSIPPATPDSASVFSQVSTVVQLLENFRLNPDIGAFISTIYSKSLRPQKSQSQEVATQLLTLRGDEKEDGLDGQTRGLLVALGKAMCGEKQSLFSPPEKMHKPSSKDLESEPAIGNRLSISLALLRLKTVSSKSQVSYETHVRGEAAVAASLVRHLQRCAPAEDIFVATPHRIQRQAVKMALKASEIGNDTELEDDLTKALKGIKLDDQDRGGTGAVIVDTIERLQGSEAGFVICLFSLSSGTGETDGTTLAFLLNRRRLNVAISRAKTMCFLISSDQVLRPSASILADGESTKGYVYLRGYEERAWCGHVSVDLDVLEVM